MEIIKSKGIIKHTDITGEQLLTLLQNEEILVYESIQGSKIWVNYNTFTRDWEIRPSSISNHKLNMVDLATQKFYKYAYAYLLSLPETITNLLRKGYQFCFEYFPDNQPANVAYDKLPKNGLILTCICKWSKYYSYNPDELKVFADLFNVDLEPQIYRGKLDHKQLQSINYYLHTGEEDLDLLYKEVSFSKFFYNTLAPNVTNSFLKVEDFNDNCEKIIIRFLKSDCELTLEILNPIYERMPNKTISEFSDVYSVLLFNFVQYLMTINIDEQNVPGNSRDLIYINFISKLFNSWLDKNSQGIIYFKFSIPEFFNQDKFKINQDLIHNTTTLDWINKNSKFEYCFKILLTSFQRERKKPIGIINDQALVYLNNCIRQIHLKIEELMNWNHKLSNFTYKEKDLTKYPNIKWQQDNDGYVQLKSPEDKVIYKQPKKQFKKK